MASPSSPRRTLTAIVAATTLNGIGLNGGLPWRLPGEMKYFARATTGELNSLPEGSKNAVIMGRKSWESIPAKFRPLKGRTNMVVSAKGINVSSEEDSSSHSSLEVAIQAIPTSTHRAFLIGGAQLYTLGFETGVVDRVLLTRVASPAFECDTYLTDFTSSTQWTQAPHAELQRWLGWDVPGETVEEKGVEYRYEMWLRKDAQ